VDHAGCVYTTEQSRTVENSRPDFGGKSGMVRGKSGMKCGLEKNLVFLE
jgi:hypothetical protein